LIELRTTLEVFEAEDEEENVGEGTDSVGVSTEHQVGETDIVVDGDVGRSHTSEESLLVEVDSVEHRKCESVVSQEDVNANEAEDREVAEMVVERDGSVFSGSGPKGSIALVRKLGKKEYSMAATHSTSSPF
jgi:hypothetical protein